MRAYWHRGLSGYAGHMLRDFEDRQGCDGQPNAWVDRAFAAVGWTVIGLLLAGGISALWS